MAANSASTLSVAVLGEGLQAEALRRAFSRHQRVRLADSEAAAQAVCLAGPADDHWEAAHQQLRSGRHVLCPSIDPAPRDMLYPLMNAVQGGRARLIVMPELRYSPPLAAARTQLQSGNFGPLISIRLNWQARADGRGALDTLGPAALDYVRWCTGAESTRLHALGGRFTAEGDMVALTLRLANGVIASVELERVLPPGFPRDEELQLDLSARDGSLRATPNEQQVTVFGGAGRSPVWDGWVTPTAEGMVAEFVRCLLDGAEPSASLDDVAAALSLVEQARARLAR